MEGKKGTHRSVTTVLFIELELFFHVFIYYFSSLSISLSRMPGKKKNTLRENAPLVKQLFNIAFLLMPSMTCRDYLCAAATTLWLLFKDEIPQINKGGSKQGRETLHRSFLYVYMSLDAWQEPFPQVWGTNQYKDIKISFKKSTQRNVGDYQDGCVDITGNAWAFAENKPTNEFKSQRCICK